ncbi:MAG TPA: hypothetical protein VFS10_20610 [Pyrinomonadaceae bacterium]|nr:hypothetical protein [Pyrinomonadaceae bacterium]
MRIALIIIGVTLAAVGGTLAYRSFFIEPEAVIVISDAQVREVPNMMRVAGGLLLLLAGAAVAFFAALRRR